MSNEREQWFNTKADVIIEVLGWRKNSGGIMVIRGVIVGKAKISES